MTGNAHESQYHIVELADRTDPEDAYIAVDGDDIADGTWGAFSFVVESFDDEEERDARLAELQAGADEESDEYTEY